jgi:hypothetical protein
VNPNGVLTDLTKPVSCDDAAALLSGGSVPALHAFNEAGFIAIREEGLTTLLENVFRHVVMFPFVNKPELDLALGELSSVFGQTRYGDFESQVALRSICVSPLVNKINLHMNENFVSVQAMPEEYYFKAMEQFWRLSDMFDLLGCGVPRVRVTGPTQRTLSSMSNFIDRLNEPEIALYAAEAIMGIKTQTIAKTLMQKSFNFLLIHLQILTSIAFKNARSSGNANIALHAYIFEHEICPVAPEIVLALREGDRSLGRERTAYLLMRMCAHQLPIGKIIDVSLMHSDMPPVLREVNGVSMLSGQMKTSIKISVFKTTENLPMLDIDMSHPEDRSQAWPILGIGQNVGLAF